MPGHDHGTPPHSHATNERRVLWVLVITLVFMAAEVVGGILSGSLALLADAGHMLTDAAALALAWVAFRIARRPSDRLRTFGYDRVQVLAAFANGLALLAIAIWIVVEAARRIAEPIEVLAIPMLVIATGGLVVNIVAFAILHGGDRDNINLRGALSHVLSDMLASAAAVIAAIVILSTGWTPIDPLLSIAVAIIVVRVGYQLVKRSAHILLEGSPEDISTEDVRDSLTESMPEVTDVHHVHAWSLTHGRPLMTLHAVVREGADHRAVLRRIRRLLATRFGVEHATIQLEPGRRLDG
jgi:cobalt-zinc-cadmium efflux system protein